MSDHHPMAQTLKSCMPKRFYNSALYLHGNAERLWRYDICFLTDWRKTSDFRECAMSFRWFSNEYAENETRNVRLCPHINGIYNVQVIGDSKPCIGFFWTCREYSFPIKWQDTGEIETVKDWRQIALICHIDDFEMIKHAKSKYEERTSCV